MSKYTHEYSVILDNMDLIEYRLRPIAAIMYVQDAFARYCGTKGVAAYDFFPLNLYWVVSDMNIEFVDNLPFWSEPIVAEIWVSEISKLKMYTDYKLYSRGKVFACGNACWYILDSASHRPSKTDVVQDKFEICPELSFGEHKKFALDEKLDKASEIVHKMNFSDIDFNKHVNNKSYLNIAQATASDDFQKTHKLKSLSIKFIRETFLDDVIVCSTYKTNMADKYAHILEKDGIEVCEIQTEWESRSQIEEILKADLLVKNE